MDLNSLLNKRFTCSYCKKEHFIPTREVVTRQNALLELPQFLDRLLEKSTKPVLILSDEITYTFAAKRAEEILKNTRSIISFVLRAKGRERIHAEKKYIIDVEKKAADACAIITVGTGSITDIGKYAAYTLRIPFICIPTAPSMNAYTSNVAAFLSDGLKVTLSATPAIGVIADTTILAHAPLELIKSGFADSLAKSFANADWKIASMLTGESFCLLPFQIASEAEKKYIHRGKDLIARNEDAIAALLEGLHLGGFSMVLAGASSPASGGEHLISHFLDMYAHKHGHEVFAYHGLQVGLGVLISSRIFERLKKLSLNGVQTMLDSRSIDYEKEIQKLFPDDRALIQKEFAKKIPLIEKWKKELPLLWPRMQEKAFPLSNSH